MSDKLDTTEENSVKNYFIFMSKLQQKYFVCKNKMKMTE